MTEPQRRFWQIHLSTAVVLMLMAGAWLLVTLLLRDHLYSVLWKDNERISPVSLRSSAIIDVVTIDFVGFGPFLLWATAGTLERHIRRHEAEQP